MNNKYKYFKVKQEDSEKVRGFLAESLINYTLANEPMVLVCEDFAEDKIEHEPLHNGEYFEVNDLTNYLYSNYTNKPEGETYTRELLDSIYNDWCTADSLNK